MIFDIIAGTGAVDETPPSTWTPAELFLNGEIGWWFDASDMANMFQDSSGSQPITVSGQSVGLWKNKIVGQANNFDLAQGNSPWRPTLNITNGKSVLAFDGVTKKLTFSAALPTIQTPNGNGFGLGFNVDVVKTGVAYYYFLDSHVFSVTADSPYGQGKLSGNILNIELTTSNTYFPNLNNAYVISGSSNQAVNTVFNGVVTQGMMPTGASGSLQVASTDFIFSFSSNFVTKVSDFVFVNRALTIVERNKLETYIRSKQ